MCSKYSKKFYDQISNAGDSFQVRKACFSERSFLQYILMLKALYSMSSLVGWLLVAWLVGWLIEYRKSLDNLLILLSSIDIYGHTQQ